MPSPERSVPFVDFKKEYGEVRGDVVQAIDRVLGSGSYILGDEVKSLEKEFANFIGVQYAVGVASGTDALTLSLKASGIGDKGVVLPANAYPSAFGVALSGAKLQLADVDCNTLNLNVETLEKVVDENTRAVIVVHLYGNPADLANINAYCISKGLLLIEDCAQASGAMYQGVKVGSFGEVACFSFYPTKNLGAYGDGGMIVTNNADLADYINMWRMYGEKSRYQSKLLGHNSRLDEIQAAILRAKLPYLDEWNRKRREIACKYKQNFSGLPIHILDVLPGSDPAYHLFAIQVKDRDEMVEYLKSYGISTGIHYPVPIHLTSTFKSLGQRGQFPVTEKASETVLSLPCNPQMEDADIDQVIGAVKSFYSK